MLNLPLMIRNSLLRGFVVLVLFFSIEFVCLAQNIIWNFGTTTGNSSPSSNTVNNLANTPIISQGNNNGTTTLLTTTSASSGYSGASGQFNAGAAARIGALNTGTGGSAYFEFTLIPAANFTVNLTSISFGSRSTSTGPQSYSVRTSLDNYASDYATGTLSNGASWALYSNTVLSNQSSSSITYRIYGYDGVGNAGVNTANWRIDDLNLAVTTACIASVPTVQVSSLMIAAGATPNTFSITLIRGNGDNVLVIAKNGSVVDANPANGTSYTANNAFGSGDQIGTGNYVVYSGTGTTFTVTGLTQGDTYYFAAYEYKNCGPTYLTTSPATNNRLPIELMGFKAELTGDNRNTLLSFSTATEQNNHHFAIQRSQNGLRFETIGQITGAGNSTTQQDYTYTDEHPVKGLNFYRLQQVDFDGQFSYSPVVSVNFGQTGGLHLAPQPVLDQLTVTLEQAVEQDTQWQVYDFAGRLLQSGTLEAESTNFEIPTATFTEGAYILRVVSGQTVLTQQFQKR